MSDEGLCLDGPFEEDVEPLLGLSVEEIRNMTMDDYIRAREDLIRGMSMIDSTRKAMAFRGQ